jgi:large subunit ribosomal protein L10
MKRAYKEQLVREYSERLGRAQVMIWSRYRGLEVVQLEALRRQLRDNNAETVVVKNKLMGIALDDAGMDVDKEMLSGASMVTFVYGDIAPATKVVMEFARRNGDEFQVSGGMVGGRLATAAQVQALTDMPSREVLLAQVLGGIQAPIAGLVGTLAATVRSVMNVLNARAEQLEEGSAS